MGKVYVSGALTGVDDSEFLKAFYEAIGSLCRELSLEAYIPHLITDPCTNPDVTPRKVFETDKYQISQSNLVVAYVGFPSLGVGMELAYAEVKDIPIILLYEQGKNISRFPRGIPTVIAEIQFQDPSDALIKLKVCLDQFRGNLSPD